MTRTRLLAALVAGLTLAGAGTAAAALTDGSTSPASTSVPVRAAAETTSATTTVLAAAPAAGPTGDDAGRTAVGHLGGGSVVRVEREVEHGRTVWDVDVRRGTSTTRVQVDATTGAVTRVEPGRDVRSRGADDRLTDDRGADDRGRHGGDRRDDDRHGGRGGDDGPGHDRGDDRGGDR